MTRQISIMNDNTHLTPEERHLPGSLPGAPVQQNVQQNLHQTQQTNNVFVNQNLATNHIRPSDCWSSLLKSVPVKIDNITKLLEDGTNFDVWDADLQEFLLMIPMAVEYIDEMALPELPGWSADMASGVNGIIHWTVDCQLGMRLREHSPYPLVRMTYLRNLYLGETFTNRLSIFHQIKTAVYDPSSSNLDRHISRMSELRRRLEKAGMFLTDDVFGAFLAVSTPSGFLDISATFEASLIANPKAIISTAKITRAMGLADIAFKSQHPGSTEVLSINNKDNSSSSNKDKCCYCKKKGHYQADCRKKKKDEEDKQKPSAKDVEVKEVESADADIGFIGCVKIRQIEVFQRNTDVNQWVVIFDTGATHHVFNDRRYFVDIRQITPLPIKMANGSVSSFITAVGTARICNAQNASETLLVKNVYLCESLRHSLLLGIQLSRDGVHFRTVEEGVEFLINGRRILSAPLEGRRWVLRACENVVAVAAVTGDFMLWHRRLGHPNNRVLLKLIRDGVCVGLQEKLTKTVPCEDCAVAKSTKTSTIGPSFISHDSPLALIVSDLCGPFPVKTISGGKYLLEIRDVHSTFMKSYILKRKDESAPIIKTYVAEIERLTGKKIIQWRTDKGGEFVNNIMKNFFASHGITVENSLPYFHEQDGAIERAKRTVQSIMRVLLRDSGLPRTFWGMAMITGTSLHNHTPNTRTNGKTPQEMLLGTIPQADHLRIFGSWAFVHAPEEKRKKLDDRVRKCRFVGYLGGSKGWKFWDPKKNEFFESAHAKWIDKKGISDLKIVLTNNTGLSSIDWLLNSVSVAGIDGEVKNLMETLVTEYRLDNHSFTTNVREQDEAIRMIQALAVGVAGRLPRTYQEAISGENGKEWELGCKKEINMLTRLKVWDEVRLPAGQRAVSSKWVFAEKLDKGGKVVKWKSRFVVRGFTQKEGVDFTETFAPTARFTSLMILITIAVKMGWDLKGFDSVSAYPHSPIEETIYVKPPEGYKLTTPGNVLLLKKALYGTKQAARCGWKFFSTFLAGMGCRYCVNDQSLYVLRYKNETALIWIHVDDGVICGSCDTIVNFIRESLLKTFEITWTEELKQIVGIRIERTDQGIFLSQPTLTSSLIESAGFATSRASTPMVANLHLETSDSSYAGINGTSYLSILGLLSYLAIGTIPDISYAVNYLARFSSRPNETHWTALKHLLRFVSGTKGDGLWFSRKEDNHELIAYCDANSGGGNSLGQLTDSLFSCSAIRSRGLHGGKAVW